MGLRILWGFHFKTKTFAAGCRSWNCKFSANCIKKLKILFIGCLRMTETSGWNLTPHLLPGQNTLGQHYNLINLAISVMNEATGSLFVFVSSNSCPKEDWMRIHPSWLGNFDLDNFSSVDFITICFPASESYSRTMSVDLWNEISRLKKCYSTDSQPIMNP